MEAATRNKKKQVRDGACESIWQSSAGADLQTSPAEDKVYDVIVVGGGITGITTALLLQEAGKQCLLIEASETGFGTTGGTSAHLNTFFDTTYPEIDRDFGETASKLVAESGKEALSFIRELTGRYAIDCDFEYKDGVLFSQNKKETEQLAEILASSKAAGIAVEEAADNGVHIPFERALRFAQQAQFHPLKYIRALAAEFLKLNGTLLEHTFAEGAEFKNGVHLVKTADAVYQARHLIYATHMPPGITLANFTCAPYRSYVLGLTLKDDRYPDCLSYDMQEPYHYFRSHKIDGQRYLLVGGEDHKTGEGDPAAAFERLESYVRTYYEVDGIAFRWSSQYYVPVDGLPYIGKLPLGSDHTYVATGYNGNGMMFGTLAAMILRDQVLGKVNRYSELFSPSRIKPVAGFSEFVKENAGAAWHFVADRFSLEDLESTAQLKAGEGRIVTFRGEKLALYKDSLGKVTALSPVCTHAGCIVNFNPEELSWDCPCHGGRFDLSGKVLTGPPQKDLKVYDLNG